jgi:hypothetical protein
VDYPELIRRYKAHPILSRQEACAELITLATAERARGQALGMDGIAREANERESAFRRQQEAEGKLRTEAESKRLAAAIAERKAAQESVVELETDPVTDERVTHTELILRQHNRAMAAIQAKAAEPVRMSESELLAAHQRKTELTARYNAARDESLRPVVAVEKF